MYRVVIAEDELFVRLGIKNSVAWQDYDMTVAADVANGEEAWKKIKEFQADIVITDLLMPVMDGKQLISRIHEAGMPLYIIVITCMEDFHMVKDLLSQGIRDYILKATITEEELDRCLKRAKKHLDHYHPTHTLPLVDVFQENSQILQNYFTCQTAEPDTKELLAKKNLPLFEGSTIPVLCPIEIVYNHQGEAIDASYKNIYRNIYDLLGQKILSGWSCHGFLLEEQYFLLLLHSPRKNLSPPSLKEAHDFLASLHDELADYLNIRFSCLFWPVCHNLEQLGQAYQNAVAALSRHYLHPINSVILGSQLPDREDLSRAVAPLRLHSHLISSNFGSSNASHYLKLIDSLSALSLKSREEMIYAMMSLSHFVCRLLGEAMEDEQKQCDRLLMRYPYLYEGIQSLEILLKNFDLKCTQKQKSRYRKEIAEALKIIDKDYPDSGLTLGGIARRVGLSETYFSTLFKQELNQNFIKYLSEIRVEHAKTLLENQELKIFDIAISCGFSDEAYFSRVFKKSTGVSPSEWRSLWFQ